MEKIALITDTTADLSEDIINKYNINVLPFRIIYKDREYKDRVDITSEEVYKKLNPEGQATSVESILNIKPTKRTTKTSTKSKPKLEDKDN